MNGHLTCQGLIEFLDDYVEDRLETPERARFDEHLAVCSACVRYLEGYRGTLRALSRVARESDALPEDVPSELVEAILAARRAS